MERLTKRIQDNVYFSKGKYPKTTLCAEMETWEVRECMEKLAEFEDLEDTLMIEYGSNATVKELINLHFKHIEMQNREPLNIFRILTNEDAKLYDEWKRTKA